MPGSRAWAAVVVVVWVLLCPGSARAADTADPACVSTGLAEARVSTSLELLHDDRTYTKVVTRQTVDVPGDWAFAEALLLSRHSPAHTTAMACLTRQATGWQDPLRWWEWRPGAPEVMAEKGGRVRVVYEAHSWVSQYHENLDVGIWRLRAGAGTWSVTLRPPLALSGARWDAITVDPGAPGVESAQPWPTAVEDGSRLVWRPENRMTGSRSAPSVTVAVKPSWQRLWAAQSERLTAQGLDWVGGLVSTTTMSALLLWAAARYRPRRRTRDPVLRNLEYWAVIAVALFVLTYTDDLIHEYDVRRSAWWFEDALLRGHVFALATGALLLAFAKPPRRVWVVGALLAIPPAVTMSLPEGFDLYQWWDDQPMTSDLALAAETTASCCLMALTVLGFVAVAWRLGVDGELIPKTRRGVPSGGQPRDRELRLRIVVPAIAVWTAVVALCYALTEERNWQRASWLSDRGDPSYGIQHRSDFVWEAMWSVSKGQGWILTYSWILTALAMLAVLHTRRAPKGSPLEDPADRLLFLAFFPVAVSISGGRLANSLAEVLWIPVYMLALYAAVVSFRSLAVLEQRFEVSKWPLAAAAAARRELMEKSRVYRETHAELRRLDQGLFGDEPPERQVLEGRLDDLHDWPAAGPLPFPDRLPAQVSVVDAALALGPRNTWWANGVRGVRCALVPGLLAAVLSTWAGFVRGEAWRDTLLDLFGLPGMALGIVYWLSTWVGGGFFLGALWRVLPGRRGAVKAIPVVLAFSVPLALDALFGWFTQEGAANLALYAATMLLVLTVTGIALDLDTFRGERRYWQSRLGLLLSIYQMRYYSLQVAYLIGQLIAVITIWQFFAEPAATPPAGGK
ncbi:DUF6185 family protein [Streptomyces sp. NBC_00490]|uniref:DUF6185 family protein n=1 Tax=Streptomyces sp. NBC_00490 TaxID=2903657 RepID=UPI002E193DCE